MVTPVKGDFAGFGMGGRAWVALQIGAESAAPKVGRERYVDREVIPLKVRELGKIFALRGATFQGGEPSNFCS